MAEPEAEVIETPEVLNPVDDVRNDVAAALAQLRGEPDKPEPVEAETPPEVEAKPDHPSDPKRYLDGTFKPVKTEAAPAAPVDPKSTPVDNTAKASIPASTPMDAPPAGWGADGKQAWTALKSALPTLSPDVQASVSAIHAAAVKREQDFDAGARQWSEQKRRYEQTLSPLIQETQRLGIAPEEGLKALLGAHRMLTNPETAPQAIAQLAQQAGVDLAALASNPPAIQTPRTDPAVPHLQQTISTLESRLNGFLQNQTLGVIEKFASANPHYAAVESDVARLIPLVQQAEPGLSPAEVLQKAYDQAVWVNPEVRSKLIAEQHAKAESERIAAVQTKQAKSQKAAVSIRGSSNGAAPPPKVVNGGDVYDDVRAAIHSLRQ